MDDFGWQMLMESAEYRYWENIGKVQTELHNALQEALEVLSPFSDREDRLHISRSVVAIEDAIRAVSDWGQNTGDRVDRLRRTRPTNSVAHPSPNRRG